MKRKQRNRETTNTNHIMRRKKKVVKISDPLVNMEEEEKLDPDMQLEIISRLPFKQAVQCRCVCKSWLTQLDDNFLINNHHAKTQLKLTYEYPHASNNSSSTSRLSFISMPIRTSSSTNEDPTDSDSIHSSDSSDELFLNLQKDVDDVDIIFGVYDDDDYNMYSYKESRSNHNNPSSSFRNARTISSCNGLIFLSKPYSIIIYNPITKERLKLCTYDELYYRQYKIITYGFGYHSSTKQYKILRCSSNKKNYDQFRVDIYTLGTTGGRWRQIKTPDDPNSDYHVPGVHVNGVLYWITNYSKKRMIMSFDLGDDHEEFRMVTSLPPSHSNNTILQQRSTTRYKLGESQGSLCLIVDHFEHSSEDGDPYIEIWLMKKEKKRIMPDNTHHYSWTKVMKIGTDRHRKREYKFAGLTKTGKVLFWYNNVLTCFDHKTERFESLSSSSGAYRRTFVPHVNSLVSLQAFIRQK